jgi:hypothetical protein
MLLANLKITNYIVRLWKVFQPQVDRPSGLETTKCSADFFSMLFINGVPWLYRISNCFVRCDLSPAEYAELTELTGVMIANHFRPDWE